jgi:hypothetical protein
VKAHVSSLRKKAALKKIKKKIKVLERYDVKPETIPEGAFIPKDLAAFRLWEDQSLGLEKIGSPNTMDKPYNRGLKKQALELIERLAKNKKRKEGRTQVIVKSRAQSKKYIRLTRELTGQLHATRQELDWARHSERRSEAKVKQGDEEIAELRQKLNVVRGLRPATSTKEGGRHDGQ